MDNETVLILYIRDFRKVSGYAPGNYEGYKVVLNPNEDDGLLELAIEGPDRNERLKIAAKVHEELSRMGAAQISPLEPPDEVIEL